MRIKANRYKRRGFLWWLDTDTLPAKWFAFSSVVSFGLLAYMAFKVIHGQ